MTTTELQPAYAWDCPTCGRANFQRAVTVRLDPLDPDHAEVIRDLLDLEPDEPVPADADVWAKDMPERVTCGHCSTEFRTAEPYPADVLPEEFEGADSGQGKGKAH